MSTTTGDPPYWNPKPFEPIKDATLGWKCPNCGGGLSPFTDRCPCVPMPLRMPGSHP